MITDEVKSLQNISDTYKEMGNVSNDFYCWVILMSNIEILKKTKTFLFTVSSPQGT